MRHRLSSETPDSGDRSSSGAPRARVPHLPPAPAAVVPDAAPPAAPPPVSPPAEPPAPDEVEREDDDNLTKVELERREARSPDSNTFQLILFNPRLRTIRNSDTLSSVCLNVLVKL